MLQLTLDPHSLEDRLLLRIGHDEEQVALWLTRRLIKTLWPLLGIASLKLVPAPNIPPALRHEAAEMQRQAAAKELDYATPYRAERRDVWEGGPQVAVGVELVEDGADVTALRFTAANRGQVTLRLDARLHAGLVELLRQAVSQLDWDLTLETRPTAAAPAAMH